jgi:hypothetical protein
MAQTSATTNLPKNRCDVQDDLRGVRRQGLERKRFPPQGLLVREQCGPIGGSFSVSKGKMLLTLS